MSVLVLISSILNNILYLIANVTLFFSSTLFLINFPLFSINFSLFKKTILLYLRGFFFKKKYIDSTMGTQYVKCLAFLGGLLHIFCNGDYYPHV